MWDVVFNSENGRYYLSNSETGEKRIVPMLTVREIKIDRYQQYYDKAYVRAAYLNGEDVYHTRVVNGRKFIYKMSKYAT